MKNIFEDLTGDGCHWGVTDLYPEVEAKLTDALAGRESFTTGWLSCKKEIMSFRITRYSNSFNLALWQGMDNLSDVVSKAMTGKELDEERVEILLEDIADAFEIGEDLEVTVTGQYPNDRVSLGTLQGWLSGMNDIADQQLDEMFKEITLFVDDYIKNLEVMKDEY